MKLWTKERKISFWFHVVAFALPMIVSIVSAIFFWQRHTGNLLIAFIAIGIIEAMALSAFVMHLLEIPTKFYWLKQALPYVSSVAIAEFLWNVFIQFNSPLIAGLFMSAGVGIVIVWIIRSMDGIEESVKHYQVLSPDETMLATFRQLREQQEARLLGQFTEAAESYLESRSIVIDASTQALAKPFLCPKCDAVLSQAQFGAAKRYGYCSLCKDKAGSE